MFLFFFRIIRRYSVRLSRIIVLLFNILISNLSFKVFESFRGHFLQFSLPRLSKLRISQNIRYVRMTDKYRDQDDQIWTVLQFVE